MESWGFQVRSGETLKAYPKIGRVIHITQVHLLDSEEEEKRTGLIRVKLRVGASDFVMASLSAEDFPVVSCKYLFTKPFELSHDSKTRSLYFSGYTDDDVYGLRDNSHALSTIDEPQVEKFQSYIKSNAGKLKSGTNLKGNGSDDSAQLDDSECPQNDDKVAPMKLKSVKKRPFQYATETPASVKKTRRAAQKTGKVLIRCVEKAAQKTDSKESSIHGVATFGSSSKQGGQTIVRCSKL